MGHVVVRAPRRLQDINSVILPSLARRPSRKIPQANRFFSSKIPRANRGSFLPEIAPPNTLCRPHSPIDMGCQQTVCLHFSLVCTQMTTFRRSRYFFQFWDKYMISWSDIVVLKSCSNLQTSSNQINPNVQKVILSTYISTRVTKWPKPKKL